MRHAAAVLAFAAVVAVQQVASSHGSDHVHIMQYRGQITSFETKSTETLEVFCHPGFPPSLMTFWSSAVLRLKCTSDKYEVFSGNNVSVVVDMYTKAKSNWFYSGMPWKNKDLKLNPFQETCTGVLTKDNYSVELQIYRVNYWQVFMTLLGIFLFIYAHRLCRNVFFHYSTGMAAGVVFSLLALTYFAQRKIRASWFGWILGCYSLSLYFLTSLWYNLKSYVIENHVYVLGYFLVTGVASFAICYRMGPVENPRTLNLIQWTLQLVGLLLMYLSSYLQVASLSLALVFLTWAAVPDGLKARLQVQYRRRFFPPKQRLLTEAEYMDQARMETERALQDLRSFCRSPKCEPWKVTSRLQSPTRFAEFVQGSSHLSQDEVMDYSHAEFDDEPHNASMTDDDSSDSSEI